MNRPTVPRPPLPSGWWRPDGFALARIVRLGAEGIAAQTDGADLHQLRAVRPGVLSGESRPRLRSPANISIVHELRDQFTVFSGISHPDIGGDHASEACFLTSARHPTAGGFRNTVSLDFVAAKHVAMPRDFRCSRWPRSRAAR